MSRSSSSTSKPPVVTYRLLLQDKDRWEKLLAMFRSPGWEALQELMEAERLSHLEALVSSDSQAQQTQHLAIARWLGQFMDPETGVKPGLIEEKRLRRADVRAASEDPEGGTEWMEPDSGPTDEEHADA